MKYLPIFLIFLIACSPKEVDLSTQAKKDILKAEADMCEMAVSKGFHQALLHFAADSVVKPNDGVLPIIGKAALAEAWKNLPDFKSISWKPVVCDASRSGDFGYTFGNWQSTAKDTTFYGNYYTIWKKQSDGSWKFVIDGGNNTPKP